MSQLKLNLPDEYNVSEVTPSLPRRPTASATGLKALASNPARA
jgi:hypothetical protein